MGPCLQVCTCMGPIYHGHVWPYGPLYSITPISGLDHFCHDKCRSKGREILFRSCILLLQLLVHLQPHTASPSSCIISAQNLEIEGIAFHGSTDHINMAAKRKTKKKKLIQTAKSDNIKIGKPSSDQKCIERGLVHKRAGGNFPKPHHSW